MHRRTLLLLAAVAAVFWPALGGDYVYDDATLVVRNAALRNGDLGTLLTQPLFGEQLGYWRPLSSLLLWLGDSLGGAAGVHALALSLHAAATLAAHALAARLLAGQTAFWAALLFAVHPVQAESVAWCSAISDPLWSLCALQAMRAALRFRDGPGSGVPWATFAWCLAALLAKESAIVVLLLVPAAVAWAPPAAPPAAARPNRATLLAAGGAVAVWLLLRMFVFHELTAGLLRAPATAPVDTLRLVSAPPELLLRHLALLAVPFPLTPFREFAEQVQPLQGGLVCAAAAALLLGLAWGWRRLPVPARLALALAVVPLLPTLLRFHSIGAYPVGDRYLHLAAFGFALVVVSVAQRVHQHWLPWLLAAVSAPLCFAHTWVWHDQGSLVAHGLRWSPEDPKLLVMSGDLALARAQAGDAAALADARADYTRAEQLAAPGFAGHAHHALGSARLGLAWCLLIEQGGRRGPGTPALLAAFQRAVDAEPDSAAAWVGLGVANGVAEQPAAAEQALRKALALDPDHGDAWFNLGYLQSLGRRVAEARASLEQALRCNPGHEAARRLLDRLR